MEGEAHHELGSRLFIVCGKAVEVRAAGTRRADRATEQVIDSSHARGGFGAVQEEELKAAFVPYGAVQNVKVIRDKGGGCSWAGPADRRIHVC